MGNVQASACLHIMSLTSELFSIAKLVIYTKINVFFIKGVEDFASEINQRCPRNWIQFLVLIEKVFLQLLAVQQQNSDAEIG